MKGRGETLGEVGLWVVGIPFQQVPCGIQRLAVVDLPLVTVPDPPHCAFILQGAYLGDVADPFYLQNCFPF